MKRNPDFHPHIQSETYELILHIELIFKFKDKKRFEMLIDQLIYDANSYNSTSVYDVQYIVYQYFF